MIYTSEKIYLCVLWWKRNIPGLNFTDHLSKNKDVVICYCFFYLLLHCNWVVLNLPNVCLGILSHFCLDLKFYVLQSPEYVSRSLGVRVKRENRTIKIVESVYRDWNKFWLNCRVFLYFDYISPAMQYSVYNFRQKLSFYQKIVKSFIRSAEVDFFFSDISHVFFLIKAYKSVCKFFFHFFRVSRDQGKYKKIWFLHGSRNQVFLFFLYNYRRKQKKHFQPTF